MIGAVVRVRLSAMAARVNPFIIALIMLQTLIIVAYHLLTTHANMGNGTKLDEARQRQKDREELLKEPTPAPAEYEYGQQAGGVAELEGLRARVY